MGIEQIEKHFHPSKKHGGYKKTCRYTKHLKKCKKRLERRRAKKDPECAPLYNKYDGWEY